MLRLTITDTREQTAAVFQALAVKKARLDLAVACLADLAASPSDVAIPYADGWQSLVPPVAVRLRRDFRTVLCLIRAHALLHQATRRKDDGRPGRRRPRRLRRRA